MGWRLKTLAALAGAAMIGGGASVVLAQTPAPSAPATPTPAPRFTGYLGKDGIPNSIAILPPPPADGSLAEQADFADFLAMRKLAGSPRWTLAARDAVNYLGAFDCPLGLALDAKTTPKTMTLLRRIGADAGSITNLAKDHFGRHRPLWGNAQPICTEDQRASLLKSESYPSGHTTYSWAVGLVLAEMAPDKATEILARARAFGESRAVCGVHFVSDVQEGRTNGSSLVAVLHSNAEFQADLAAAKKELKEARAMAPAAPDAAECKIEDDAEMHTPWINPTGVK